MANTFKSKRSSSIGTVATSVGGYTVPASTQTTAIGLTLANITANTVQVSASYYDGTTDIYIVRNATLVPGGSIVAIGGNQKTVIEVGHSIRVTASANNSVDAVMSILEIT